MDRLPPSNSHRDSTYMLFGCVVCASALLTLHLALRAFGGAGTAPPPRSSSQLPTPNRSHLPSKRPAGQVKPLIERR